MAQEFQILEFVEKGLLPGKKKIAVPTFLKIRLRYEPPDLRTALIQLLVGIGLVSHRHS